jgi:hypothetical protein
MSIENNYGLPTYEQILEFYKSKGDYFYLFISDVSKQLFFQSYNWGGTKKPYDCKLHIMCKMEYVIPVINTILNRLLGEDMPFLFKISSEKPITSGTGFYISPYSTKLNLNWGFDDYTKRVSPSEIKKNPIKSLDGSTTYSYNGGEYDFEYVFDPTIVLYTTSLEYTRQIVNILLEEFPDEKTTDIVYPNFYPRFSLKMNNMIYLSTGQSSTKIEDINKDCKLVKKGHAVCDKLINVPPLPREYKEIADSCPIRNKEECTRSYSTLSDHSLCKWNHTQQHCESRKSMSPHFLLDHSHYPSLESFYTDVEQPAVYQSAKQSWEDEKRRIEERIVREQAEKEREEREEREKERERKVALQRIMEKQHSSYGVNSDDFNVDFSLGDSYSFWPFGKKHKSKHKRNKKRNLSKKQKK